MIGLEDMIEEMNTLLRRQRPVKRLAYQGGRCDCASPPCVTDVWRRL